MPIFKRVNLCVADLERALTIYRDILGFTLNEIIEAPPDSYAYPVFLFPTEAKIRFARLDGTGQDRALALTEVRGMALPAPQPPHMYAGVIHCADFDDVVPQLKALKLRMLPEQILKEPDGRLKGRETAFVDYDGHLIVIYKLFSH